jgi:hypothetical protein
VGQADASIYLLFVIDYTYQRLIFAFTATALGLCMYMFLAASGSDLAAACLVALPFEIFNLLSFFPVQIPVRSLALRV